MDLDSLGRQRKWNIYGIGRNQCSHANFLWLPSLGLMRICTHASEGSADMVHGEQMMAARRCLWSVFASHGSTDALSFALLEKCFSLLSPDPSQPDFASDRLEKFIGSFGAGWDMHQMVQCQESSLHGWFRAKKLATICFQKIKKTTKLATIALLQEPRPVAGTNWSAWSYPSRGRNG